MFFVLLNVVAFNVINLKMNLLKELLFNFRIKLYFNVYVFARL